MASRSGTPGTPTTLVSARLSLQTLLSTHPSSSAIGNAAIISGLSTALTPLDVDYYTVKDKLGLEAPAGVDLSHAKQVLRVLASLGEGGISVPGLKSAAQIGLEIINVADTADANEEACRMLALQVFRLIQSVSEKVEEDTTLHKHIDALKSDLIEILQCLKIIAARNVARKLFHAESDRDTIVQCEKLLDHSRQLFIVNLQLDQAQQVSKIDDKVDAILAFLHAPKKAGGSSKDARVSQNRSPKRSPRQSEANPDDENGPTNAETNANANGKAASPATRRHAKSSKSLPSESAGPQNHGNGNALTSPNPIPNPLQSPYTPGPSGGVDLGLAIVGAALSQGASPIINIGGGNIVNSTFKNVNNTQQYIDHRNRSTTIPFTHNSPQSLNSAHLLDQSKRQRIEDGQP